MGSQFQWVLSIIRLSLNKNGMVSDTWRDLKAARKQREHGRPTARPHPSGHTASAPPLPSRSHLENETFAE